MINETINIALNASEQGIMNIGGNPFLVPLVMFLAADFAIVMVILLGMGQAKKSGALALVFMFFVGLVLTLFFPAFLVVFR